MKKKKSGPKSGKAIKINPRKPRAQRVPVDDPKILTKSTYRNLDEPCPLCGAPTVEFVRGDKQKYYWCTELMCTYMSG